MAWFSRQSIASFAIAGFFVILSAITLQVRRPLLGLILKIEATSDYAGRAASHLDKAAGYWQTASQDESAFLKNNLPLVTDDVEKTLSSVNSTVLQLKDTASSASDTMDAIRGDADTLTLSANDAIGKFTILLSTANDSVKGLQPVEQQATALIQEVRPAAVQLSTIAANTKSMTDSGSRILKDGADEADKLAHPPKKKLTFWGAMWATAQAIHKLEPPLF